ncbi:hypothetical protein ET495_10030 [Xylanimonas allomyrinae]|uniref:Uncharacterized protein n=1 Tax=Xylanimonas allomyrinae TaxID=2509459 RepID=A0A4P6EQ52_9MICO|nr:hypothetical protein [Xylanimonas allomyrinae]QAY63529.1 hypothetical protein ET495_10030 [Xylanimonas allomyrinae]
MSHFFAMIAVAKAWLIKPDDDPERGSHTTDVVLWTLGVIVIAGIVIAAVTAYVTAQAGRIQ